MRRSWTIGGGLLTLGLALGCRHTQPQPEGCTTCGNQPTAVQASPVSPPPTRLTLVPTTPPLVPATPSLVPDDLPVVTLPRRLVTEAPAAMPPVPTAPVASVPTEGEQQAAPPVQVVTPAPAPVIVQRPVLTERGAVTPSPSAWAMPQAKAVEQPHAVTAAPAPVAAAPGNTPSYYNSPDYSILFGVLDYNARRGTWRLRFADAGEEDRYGGSVTLDGVGRQMQEYTSGQTVRVEGALVDPESREASPAYRVKDMRPATDAK